jgi:signal transduction histidine kinase
MLTISRIEGNRFNLDLKELNLVDLLKQVKNELFPIAKQKNLNLNLEVENKLFPVVADANKILEVLHNLIGNAIKFTHKGTVTIKCFTKSKQNFCHVIDTGMGIDKADYSKLFRKFARLEKSYVKIKETGTGLGLYVSREIMRRHGGDIVFKSELGKGSTFTIIFPKT